MNRKTTIKKNHNVSLKVSEVHTYLTITENSSCPPPHLKVPNENGDSTEPENAELFHFTDIQPNVAFKIIESVQIH